MDEGCLGWPPCDVCGQPLTTTQGVLVISETDALDRAEDIAAWRRSAGDGPRQFGTGPRFDEARWRWVHDRCRGDPITYEIGLDRLDNYAKVLGWSWHLSNGKTWFQHTDWFEAINKAWVIDRNA